MTVRRANRAAVRFLLGAAAAFSIAGLVAAAQFGAPPGPGGGDPPGWLMLVNPDAGDPVVSDGWGDVAHFMTFYIEVADTSGGLEVEVFDPGLFDPAGGNAQLDVNLDPRGGAGVGEIRYILFAPDDSVLADVTWGSDTAATDRAWWTLHSDMRPDAGLHHLVVEIPPSLEVTEDIAVFGLRVPGHQVWSYNLTIGEAPATTLGDPLQGGATVSEPVAVHPFVMQPSPGSDAFGPVCGLQFVSYDMEAAVPGIEPPVATITTRTGFSFPTAETPPSGDSRWLGVDLGGVDVGPLDSDDHGIWSWSVSQLDGADLEDLFSNITPIDVNAFSLQLLDYGAADRDFLSWADLPDRPPWVLFNPDAPRRLYLPADDWSPPARAYLGHSAEIVGGFPVVSAGETTTLEVTVVVDNPHPYELTGLDGVTTVAPGPELTDPVVTGAVGLVAVAAGRRIVFDGDVAPGTTASFTYRVDLTPSMLGRGFVTGDGADFVAAMTAPTVATYQTPYTDAFSFELPEETLGPICQLEYEAIVPPCAARAEIVPSGPLQTCPGTEVTLDASGSEIFHCDDLGGVPIYQWSVNGMIVDAFPDADPVRVVTPFANDEWTFEIACSTEPADCIDAASVVFDLHDAPVVDAGADREICAGESTDLEALVMTANPPAADFLWTTDPPGEDGDGATNAAITVAPGQTTTYTFSTVDAQGCEGRGSVTVNVRSPQPSITPANPELCGAGDSVLLAGEAGFVGYAWSTMPPGLPGDGSTDPTLVASAEGTYTLEVIDTEGCAGSASVTVTASPDLVPGPLGPSLRVTKVGTDDLRLRWTDLAEPVSGYDPVSLDCDPDADGRCDQDPEEAVLDALPTAPPGIAPGVEEVVVPGAQRTASFLVFWKVRGLSPCSSQPGPFLTP